MVSTRDARDPDAQPRGIVLSIDEDAGTVELDRELLPPRPVDSSSQGDLTLEDDGSAKIGWGSANLVTSYDADDEVTWDGATGIAMWELFAGGSADAMTSVDSANADGLEASLPPPQYATVIAMRALDADDEPMGEPRTVC